MKIGHGTEMIGKEEKEVKTNAYIFYYDYVLINTYVLLLYLFIYIVYSAYIFTYEIIV
ncbi:hypothetical protein LX87_02297 [Larkinella arboricola]|uniref:Uncharacterized protein n=1 Tax=Larkinella arboricola TaxID=643671 RepID=A0A327WVM7_LARAB|nr:hypothetical protein LX87_02297 [Larkinella arboricola]